MQTYQGVYKPHRGVPLVAMSATYNINLLYEYISFLFFVNLYEYISPLNQSDNDSIYKILAGG
jgi:hypothetical protein